ncbi:MAG: hypothetical protein U1F26_16970 [Lysobacterales bacterium]
MLSTGILATMEIFWAVVFWGLLIAPLVEAFAYRPIFKRWWLNGPLVLHYAKGYMNWMLWFSVILVQAALVHMAWQNQAWPDLSSALHSLSHAVGVAAIFTTAHLANGRILARMKRFGDLPNLP